ncbi:ABC transporter ATP-binding protein [Roseibium sp.]|uniref:ABC transporter ATP-binding protein n=1 Tax=Roseibium sp. TaxID=1936156 RepID=UPI003A97502A
MIKVHVANKSFGKTQVLSNVNFALPDGKCLAILGKSGVGKSTLLRIIAGIDDDFEGKINRPERMAFVFQEPTLLPWRSAIDNILIVHPGLERRGAEAMLVRVGLGGKADQFPGQLSLGQQRRLSLARAFAGQPELLILDEPFVSLDEKTAEQMVALTRGLMREISPTTLFVTHEREEARLLADHTIELVGSPATLAPNLVRADFIREELR